MTTMKPQIPGRAGNDDKMNRVMKQTIYIATLVVLAFFAAACQREELVPVGAWAQVTFDVEVAGAVVTKADGAEQEQGQNPDQNQVPEVNNLVYAVYRTDASTPEEAERAMATLTSRDLVYQYNPVAAGETTTFVDGKAHVGIELISQRSYIILFWAQVDQTWVKGTDFNLLNITYPEGTLTANSEAYAAYSGVAFVSDIRGSRAESVTLSRPFAQVNIASSSPSSAVEILSSSVKILSSSVTITGAASTFNVATQTAGGDPVTVTFEAAPTPDGQFSADYKHYIARNYIFANGPVSVGYVINTENHGTISTLDAPICNVPVAKNYRTNILGNLLTSDITYDVDLQQSWTGELPNEPVASVGGVEYTTLEAAAAAAKTGDTITVLKDINLSSAVTLAGGITFNGDGHQINGTLIADGSLTFAGHTKVEKFVVGAYGRTITIPEGVCLEITEPFKAGYGNTFKIGNDQATQTSENKSLIIPGGIVIEGGSGDNFQIYNTKVEIGSITTTATSGAFNFNLYNSEMIVARDFSLTLTTANLYLSNSKITVGGSYTNQAQLSDTNSQIIVNNQDITNNNINN